MTVEAIEAVRKSVVVAAPAEKAWEVFVERIGEWWPLAGHSIGGDDAVAAVVDGDRIYERTRDGTKHTWGRITTFEPPTHLAFTWQVHRGAETHVDIRFTPEGDGTRVDLVHGGWTAEAARRSYDEGWSFVLGRFESAVSR